MRRPLMRCLVPLLAAAVLLGCSTADDEGSTPLGLDPSGSACRLVRSGASADVRCGQPEAVVVRIRQVQAAPADQLAGPQRTALAGRLACDPPSEAGAARTLMVCRRINGGWPAFALVTNRGGRAFQADGNAAALPLAERAIAVLTGAAAPAADSRALPSDLDGRAAALARQAFASGDVSRFDQLMAVGRDANQAERFAAAETAYRAALALQQRAIGADNPDTFNAMARLALQISNQGRHPEAEALFARAAPLAPRSTDRLAPAQLVHLTGLHEANRGRPDAALAAFANAEALYSPLLPADAAADLTTLDQTTARALVGVVEARRNRAALLRSAGRLAEADAAQRSAEALAATAPGIVGADLIAARLQRTGAALAAQAGAGAAADRRFAASATRFSRGVPGSRPYAETQLLRANAALSTGAAPSSVLSLCRDATTVLARLREGAATERVAPCVGAYIAAARQNPARAQDLLAEGFETAQLAQSDIAATQIAQAAARLTAGARDPAVAEALRRREATARTLQVLLRTRDETFGTAPAADLAGIDARIADAATAAAEADATAVAAAPGFVQLVQSVVPMRDAQAALRADEALISIILPPTGRGSVFVVSASGIAAGTVGRESAEITALVGRVRGGVESGDGARPFDAGAAHDLHTALFAEVADAVAAARRLVVAPSGALLTMPLGLLVEAPPPRPDSHEGARFLLDRAAVAHVPAPASLVLLRRAGPSRASRPWIGFGDPVPLSQATAARAFPAAPACGRLLAALPALPATRVELAAAAQFAGAGAADPRTGTAFTPVAVLRTGLRDYRVLHFATHAVLPSELSCLSEPAIVASAGAGTDPLLTAGKVLDLELDADLVVLSACNTAAGAPAGDSLSAMARAFFFAGARSLVATHWYVADVAAARVSALALRNLAGGTPRAEALRAAQLDLKRLPGGGHPALWAPFALVGVD